MTHQDSDNPVETRASGGDSVDLRRVFRLWLPLAGSWLLMAIEGPICNAFIARLPDEKTQLAAFGAVGYPIAMFIEAPVIALLAASTRMAVDRRAWLRLYKIAHFSGLFFALVHGIVAFTPIYDWIAGDLIAVDEAVVEPGRRAMQWLLPWSWLIAWRRMQQGVLIHTERSRPIVIGTLLRVVFNTMTLVIGVRLASQYGWPAAAVGAAGITFGLLAEALFIEFAARRLAKPLLPAEAPDGNWSYGEFVRFYLPLAFVPFLPIAMHPTGAAVLSRLPGSLEAVAVWGSVTSFVFLFRSGGFAFNEVVVSLVKKPGGLQALQAFAWRLAAFLVVVLTLVFVTPLGRLWFESIGGIQTELATVALAGLPFALTQPIAGVYLNLFQGVLVRAGRTSAVTESVVIYSVSCPLLFALVLWREKGPSIPAVFVAIAIAQGLQIAWVAWRSDFGRLASKPAS
ncbi:MAG: hypothetical protein AAF196_05365 [Planctomycetota bacterium]